MIPQPLRRLFACVVLVQTATLISHDLVYAFAYGLGDRFAAMMAANGHDGYWTSLVVSVAVVAGSLLAATAWQLRRLALEARAVDRGLARIPEPSFRSLLPSITRWSVALALSTASLYLAQENLESVGVAGTWAGLAPILGDHVSAVPIFLAVGLAMGVVMGLVSWRRAIFVARIRAATASARRRTTRSLPRGVLEHRPSQAVRSRPYAGRAPPVRLLRLDPA